MLYLKLSLVIAGVVFALLILDHFWQSGSDIQPEVLGSQTDLTQEEFVKLNSNSQFEYIRNLVKDKSLGESWQFIQNSYMSQKGASNGPAHDLAHLMGELIFDKAGFSGLPICNPTFAFGCYHGFLDKAFLKGTENLNLAEQACGRVGPINSGPFGSCIHGIGHGLASFHQTKDLKAALLECDRLTNGQDFCYDGVFMEFERSAPKSFYKAEDYLYPCNNLEEKYQISCGRNQPQVLLDRFNQNFDQVIGICETSENADFKQACFDSLGFMTVIISTGDPGKIISLCQNNQHVDFQNHCLKAAAGEIVFENIPLWREKSGQVCLSLADEFLKNDCLGYISQLALEYSRR